MRTYRLIFLGAGFSRPAGLPLGRELFKSARLSIQREFGPTNHVERDLKRYLEYKRITTRRPTTISNMEFEDFLGFLDVEHYLGLKGSDTWSEDGNESQLMIRAAIGRVLLDRTPTVVPDLYRRFVGLLNPSDWIFTFNYDTLLECALEKEGISYRLFPNRYANVGPMLGEVDYSRDEVVVLKMHGSVDWVSREPYDLRKAAAASGPIQYEPKHPLFGPTAVAKATPLVEGPRFPDDPLQKIYRTRSPEVLYRSPLIECCPVILSPSDTKLLYARPLKEFWNGMSEAGGLNLGLWIIGYSLPQYDSYARQALFSVCRNYSHYQRDLILEGQAKRKINLLTLAKTAGAIRETKRTFGFLDWTHTRMWTNGLSVKALNWLGK